jgi:hypothetical protein
MSAYVQDRFYDGYHTILKADTEEEIRTIAEALALPASRVDIQKKKCYLRVQDIPGAVTKLKVEIVSVEESNERAMISRHAVSAAKREAKLAAKEERRAKNKADYAASKPYKQEPGRMPNIPGIDWNK